MSHLPMWCLLFTCVATAASGAQPRAPVQKARPIESRPLTSTPEDACGFFACFADARTRSITLAWANGLDEHGAPLDSDARAAKLAEAESLLRRLPGTFRIEGIYRNRGGTSQVGGTARCVGIPNGPGLSCALSAAWKAPKESRRDPVLDKALHEAMQSLVLVLGVDPGTSEVRGTLMEVRGVKVRGLVIDDAVVFSGEMATLDSFVPYTWMSSFLAIRPGGDVEVKFEVHPTEIGYMLAGVQARAHQSRRTTWIGFELQLHRESQAAAGSQ